MTVDKAGPHPGTGSAVPGASADKDDKRGYIGLVKEHPTLSDMDKRAMLWLMQQSPAFEYVISNDDTGIHNSSEWKTFATMLGIKACLQDPVAPERVYKLRGIGEIQAPLEVIYEMLIEVEYMKKWDPLLADHVKLSRTTQPYPLVAVGHAMNTYGIPALSLIFNTRQLMYRVASVHFTDGTRVLLAYGPPEGTVLPNDPGTGPRQIRAHMGISGYVLTPLSSGSCQLTALLQVDPKGSVPLPVYNTVSMAMPLGITKMRAVANSITKNKDLTATIIAKHQANVVESQEMRRKRDGMQLGEGVDAAVAVPA